MNIIVTTALQSDDAGIPVDKYTALMFMQALQEIRASGYDGVRATYSESDEADKTRVDTVAVRDTQGQWITVDSADWADTIELVQAFDVGLAHAHLGAGHGTHEIVLDEHGAWTHRILDAIQWQTIGGPPKDTESEKATPLPEAIVNLLGNYQGSAIGITGSGSGGEKRVDSITLHYPFAKTDVLASWAESFVADSYYANFAENEGGQWAVRLAETRNESGDYTWAIADFTVQDFIMAEVEANLRPLQPMDYVTDDGRPHMNDNAVLVAFSEFMEQRLATPAADSDQTNGRRVATVTLAELDAWHQRFAPVTPEVTTQEQTHHV